MKVKFRSLGCDKVMFQGRIVLHMIRGAKKFKGCQVIGEGVFGHAVAKPIDWISAKEIRDLSDLNVCAPPKYRSQRFYL
jgi:hypothetical protein